MSEDCESDGVMSSMLSYFGKMSNGLMLFYLAVAGNFIGDLFSKQMQTLFTNSRISKHLIGFVVILFTIANVEDSFLMTLLLTPLIYFLFILTTKMSLKWNLMIVLMLIVVFILEKIKSSLDEDDDEDAIKWMSLFSNLIFIGVLGGTLTGSTINLINKGGLTQGLGGFISYFIGNN